MHVTRPPEGVIQGCEQFCFLATAQRCLRKYRHPSPVQVRSESGSAPSAICGTDLHYYRQPVAVRSPAAHLATGHEPVGEVETVGSGVVWPSIGDRVVVYHVVGCQKCDACRGANFKECPLLFAEGAMSEVRHGSNAEYIVVPASQCLPLPAEMSWEEGAVLSCNFGTAYGALRNAASFPFDTLGLWGLGPVGLCAIAIVGVLGIRVIGFDPSPGRRDLAISLGAVAVVDPRDADAARSVLREESGPHGPSAVIDTSGAPSAHRQLLEAVRNRGRVVLVGVGQESSIGPTTTLILKQVSVIGSWIFELSDWRDMLGTARLAREALAAIVTSVTSADHAGEAFAEADRAASGKTVFLW